MRQGKNWGRKKMYLLIGLAATISCLWGLKVAISRSREVKFLTSLPTEFRNESGHLNISKKLLKKLVKENKFLIQTAKAKIIKDKGPSKILEDKNAREYIEKYAYVYFDDFTDEIADGVLDWNNENSKLFFQLMERKYQISHRSLLKTILYLRHEIEYFNYRDSLLVSAPNSLDDLLRQTVKYLFINEKAHVTNDCVKRAILELGYRLPFGSITSAIMKVKKDLELEHFDKAFSKSNKRVKEKSADRLVRVSWEDVLAMASSKGIDLAEDSYIITSQDHSRDSRLDRFFKNHIKFALIQHFAGQCVDCEVQGELELDHFWKPKSKGGNFAMRAKDGHYVSNCIPLCRSCNASKGAKDAFQYFDSERFKDLLVQSHNFNAFLNQHLQKFNDDEMVSYEGSIGEKANIS